MKMKKMRLRLMSVLAMLAFILPAAMATGQAKGKRSGARGKGNVSVDSYDQRNRGGSSTDLGVSEIEGRIFKPAVFFVLARSDFQYQAIEFKQHFVNRIMLGALKRPF